MSFATLNATLAECSVISKAEITKNPFDSDMEDRLNKPALSSPSIFVKQETPGSQKKGFRWSIGQISKLDPADIDEFPNQEYSSTYERPEDETKAQEAINEYFSHGTILPSPWTPDNHVKRVTFSPAPPSTAYISGDEDSIITDISQNSSNSAAKKQLTDASCQTSLTLPPLFDLKNILDSGYYSYVEEEEKGSNESQKLNLSIQSLRRKLFSHEDNSSPRKAVLDQKSPKERIITRSILKSASPKNQLTSSPCKDSHNLPSDLDSPFSSSSPQMSPIKAELSRRTQPRPGKDDRDDSTFMEQQERSLQHEATFSNDDVFTSNILESSDVDINPSLIPDLSPIKDATSADQRHSFSEKENRGDIIYDEKPKNELNDGGPMKMSEFSDVSMEEASNDNNENDMDMSDLRPPTQSKSTADQVKLPKSVEHHPRDDVISCAHDDVSIDSSDRSLFNSEYDNKSTNEIIQRKNVSPRNTDHVLRTGDDVIIDDDVILFGTKSIKNTCGVKATGNIFASSNEEPLMRLNVVHNRDDEELLRHGRDFADIWESKKENIDASVQSRFNNFERTDKELVNRASAAMRRAEKLVKETRLEQGTRPEKTGTSAGYLNWSRVGGTSMWHPIDMSTPVVHEKIRNHPSLGNGDASSGGPREVLDVNSYNNLLNSFANSRLDQMPRSYSGAAGHDSGLGTIRSTENYSKSRGSSLGLEPRRRRSVADVRNPDSSSSPHGMYMSGRYGYNGITGKRFSWPPWKLSRSRHFSGRSISSTIPSGQLRQRYKVEPNLGRVDALGNFLKPLNRTRNYMDYFDGMHSNSRKTYSR